MGERWETEDRIAFIQMVGRGPFKRWVEGVRQESEDWAAGVVEREDSPDLDLPTLTERVRSLM